MKKSSFWLSTAAALAVSIILAGCGSTYYFAGRVLPPSGLVNRVLVAIQNPGAAARGALEIMDAHYDTRFKYDNPSKTYSVSGFSGALPITIQNMPEEQIGAVYASGDGSFTMVNYQKEAATGGQSGLPGPSSSIFITRNQQYVVAASQTNSQLTVLNLATGLGASLSLPGVYRVSVNPGGSVFIAFVQNSNYAYYGLELNTSQTLAFSGGPTTWPKAAVDCEPLNVPTWCLFEVQSPDHVDQYGIHYGAPLAFDRPVKAVFSNDGSIAYVLNCGPECGGTASSISLLPTGPMIFLENQQSGKFPVTGTVPNIPITGGVEVPCAGLPPPEHAVPVGDRVRHVPHQLGDRARVSARDPAQTVENVVAPVELCVREARSRVNGDLPISTRAIEAEQVNLENGLGSRPAEHLWAGHREVE